MKLSELYTTGTVAKRNNDGSSVAYVCTKTLAELYPDLGMDFDTTILLNNGSTSELLNTGAFGQTATAYNKSNTLYNGEPSKKIQFLGCCIVKEWGFGTFINLSKHLISNASWDSNFKLRFVINVISNENIGYNDYQPFNIDDSTNVVYDFNSTYVVCNFGYKKTNTTRDISGYVQNPHELDGTGTDGDTGKRICYDEYSVMATAYNKYLADTASISKSNIGELAFAYLINGDYFLVRKPLYVPDSGYNHMGVTIDSTKYYLTIGGFKEFDNGISGFLPANDETKGAFAFRTSSGGQYVNCTNYFVTSNCAEYVLNSCGLRWVTTESISTAKEFRDNVRLGVMDKNGIINHKEWIVGESGIQASDNPNKDTSYDNIPDRPTPGGDDDDNSDDINFGYAFSGAGAFTNLWYCTQKDLADLRQWFLGADAQHPIPEGFDPMPSIIGLFQYPISLGGDVLEEIKFRTSSGLIVSTGVQAARGLSTNLKFDLGSINIPARMRERGVPFLDYESTVECYVPFCGVFQLDTQTVIGKTLSCTLWMSPATGECNCIVYTISNGIKAPVAYGSGNMSSQIPISSNGWGSYAAALKNATIQKNQIVTGAATGGISSVLSGTGNIAATLDLGEQIAGQSVGSAFGAAGLALGGAGAALGLLSTGIKAYQDINAANVGIRHLKASNGTSINGAFSGQSAWNYPMTPYIKISRPHFKKPSNYAHTQGIPLIEAKKLSECSGFTMCVGADLTGITATQTERDIISAYLTNGIIV